MSNDQLQALQALDSQLQQRREELRALEQQCEHLRQQRRQLLQSLEGQLDLFRDQTQHIEQVLKEARHG